MPTAGLLNTIGAPQLGLESTYKAMYTHTPMPTTPLAPDSSSAVAAILEDLAALGYETKAGLVCMGKGNAGGIALLPCI